MININTLRESFSYNPVTGDLIRTKRNKGQKVLTDKVCLSVDGRLVRLSTNRVCYALGTGIVPARHIRKINKKGGRELSNLTTETEKRHWAVCIIPNSKNTQFTRVRWRVGTKYAQKTLQTPSEAVFFAKDKERELKQKYG